MNVRLESSWKALLKEELASSSFAHLAELVRSAYQTSVVYPPPAMLFRALDTCPVEKVKLVILGQDPYHGKGQAHGLAFSVQDGVAIPPSLRNIFKELKEDVGVDTPLHGNLTRWTEQGVLLLNATLSVEEGKPGSHQEKGWEGLTDAIIKKLASTREHLVFVLWGKFAQRKAGFIDPARHLILSSAHPSPFSAYQGFFGSRPFSRANAYLTEHGKEPIDWRL